MLVIKASAAPKQLQLKGTLEKGRVKGGEERREKRDEGVINKVHTDSSSVDKDQG